MRSQTLLGAGLVLVMWATASVQAASRTSWRFATTDHFEALSSASEKRTRTILTQLEQFRASFLSTFALSPAHEPRVTVMLFGSDREFTPFKPLYQGRPKDVTGFFIGGGDEVVIALRTEASGDEEDDPTETILHEYVHLLVHTRGLRLPTWLNEGLAELFSTFTLSGSKVEYGRPKEHYVDVLNVSALMPLARLMAVTESSPDYNEEHRAGMFYAQSWALAHFLVCGEDRAQAQRLGRYLQALAADPSAPQAKFREIYGAEFDKLEGKLRSYLQGGRYYKRTAPAPLGDLTNRIQIRAASDFERDFALLNLRWRVHRAGDAMLAALQLAQQQPQSPRPSELLAAIAAQEGEVERAYEHWQRAAELGGGNAFSAVQAARWRLRELGPRAGLERRLAPDDAASARSWLDRALTLSPLHDEAIETIAWVEARAPEFRIPIINLVQQRVGGLKEPHATLLALAVIRFRAGDLATASSIVQAVMESSRAKPELKEDARFLRWQLNSASGGPEAGTPPPPRAAPLLQPRKFLESQPGGTPPE